MSPGELKQLEIRRVLEKKADVYLFDEPTASLDIAHKEALINAQIEARSAQIEAEIQKKQIERSLAKRKAWEIENPGKVYGHLYKKIKNKFSLVESDSSSNSQSKILPCYYSYFCITFSF